MIQRVQSLFILLVIISCTLLLVFPYKIYSAMNPQPMIIEITMLPLFKAQNVSALVFLPAILNLVVLLLACTALFSFKKRLSQIKLLRFSVLILVLNIVCMYLINFFPVDVPARSVRWAFVLPVLSLLSCYLAIRFIRKDEDLVRSADRLR